MAVVQKYKKYALEKKQISRDRGKTWEDVTPSETRYGEELGIFDTLEECEDTNCDLEMYGTVYVDEPIRVGYCTRQTEGWGQMTLYTTLFPSGLAKSIHFTDGMYCCIDSWGCSTNIIKDEYHDAQWTTPTATITGPLQPVRRYNTFELNGREMISGEFCNHDTCFTIDEWMPWVDPNGTLKMAYKVHYVRNHCSEDWVIDEEFEPQFITIAERWRKTYEDAYKSVWQHQVASEILYEGFSPMDGLPFQVVWQDEGESVEYFYETNIPENVTFIDTIRGDGIAANNNATLLLPKIQMKMTPIVDGGKVPSGNLIAKKYHYVNDTSGYTAYYYVYDYQSETKYYIDGGGYKLVYPNQNNTVNFDKWELGSVQAKYCGLMCGINISGSANKISEPRNPVNNTNINGLILFDSGEVLFPYKIRSDYGWSDEYLNGCEYGFMKSNGTKIVVEYVYGKYTDTNGVTRNITNNANSVLTLPSNAVSIILADSITEIPENCFLNNTNLTSITMNNVSKVGYMAFAGTLNLPSITFSTPNTKLYDKSFANSGLRSLNLNNVIRIESENTSTSNVGAAFSGCTQLETLTIGSSLTNIPRDSFLGCNALRSVTIPSNVRTIDSEAFKDCTSLTSLTLSEGVTTIGFWSFMNCKLKEVTIPSTVTSYGYAGAFRANPLEKVTIHSTATITADTFVGGSIKCLTMTPLTPPTVSNGRAAWGGVFDFAPDAVILVPCEAVNTYKTDGGNEGWHNVASKIHPIPNEYRWVDNGYICVDGMKYRQEKKQGRNTECSSDDSWYDLAEYRISGEAVGECLYDELYYLKRNSSHTGVIRNLGVTLKDNTKIEIKVNPSNNGGGLIIGEVNAPSDSDDYRLFWANDKIYYDYGDSRLQTASTLNTAYTLEVGNYYIKNLTTGNYIFQGDTKSGVATAHTRTLGLFGSGDNAWIYYIKIYEGDRLVKNFIPVRREDGLVTLYDTVGRTFCEVDNGSFEPSSSE